MVDQRADRSVHTCTASTSTSCLTMAGSIQQDATGGRNEIDRIPTCLPSGTLCWWYIQYYRGIIHDQDENTLPIQLDYKLPIANYCN